MSPSQIGKDIKARRRLFKITQNDLSEISGVSLRTIKAIEKGGTNATLAVLLRVLEPLGRTLCIKERIDNE